MTLFIGDRGRMLKCLQEMKDMRSQSESLDFGTQTLGAE